MNKYYLLVVLLAATNTCSNVLIKIGASKIASLSSGYENIANFVFKLITNWFLVFGLTLFGLGFALWVFILNKVQLSTAAPIMSLSYVFIMVISYFLFKEPITGVKVAGVLSILLGVILITR